MKLSKIACTLGLALLTIPAFAQYEGTNTYDRIRMTVAPEDTIDAQGNVYSFQTDLAAQNWKDAYKGWKWLIEKAPFSITALYKSSPYMLYTLITTAETAEEKKVYLDDLMNMFDLRVKNLPALNSFDKYPASEGDVLTYKAYWYYRCGSGVDPNYNFNTIYNYYKDGITSVATMGGHDVEPAILYEFYTTSKKLYDTSNAYYYDQYLLDYITTTKACEKMMQVAKEETDTAKQHEIVTNYDKILQYIKYDFKQSPAANVDSLAAHYATKIEEKQGDYEYLINAINIMDGNNCTSNEAYYNACQYAYDIEPTYESALGCARKEEVLGNTGEAKTYYEKAIELTDDNQERAKICASVATSLANNGNSTEAMTYAKRITEYDESQAGLAAWTLGEIYAGSQQWDKAIESLRQAGEVDVTLLEEANRTIAKIEQYKSNVAAAQAEAARRAAAQKAAQQAAAQQAAAKKAAAQAAGPRQLSAAQLAAKAEYDKKMAEYKRKKAEYDKQKAAYDARKKADDAFWGGGK